MSHATIDDQNQTGDGGNPEPGAALGGGAAIGADGGLHRVPPSQPVDAAGPPASPASQPAPALAPAAAPMPASSGAATQPWRAALQTAADAGRGSLPLAWPSIRSSLRFRRGLVIALTACLALYLLPWGSILRSIRDAMGGVSELVAKEPESGLGPDGVSMEKKSAPADPNSGDQEPRVSSVDRELEQLDKQARVREREFEEWKREQDRIRERNRELDLRIASDARVRAVVDLSGEALDRLASLRQELRLWKAKVESLDGDEDGRRIAARTQDVLAFLQLTAGQATTEETVDKIEARVKKILDDVQKARSESETFAPSPELDDQLRRERDETNRLRGELKAKRARLEALIETAPPQAAALSLDEAVRREALLKAEEERKAAVAEREKWRGAMLKSVAAGERLRNAEKARALDILLNSVWASHWPFIHPRTRKIEELDDPNYHEWVDAKARSYNKIYNLELAMEACYPHNEDVLQHWLTLNGIIASEDYGTAHAKKWSEAYRRDIGILLKYYPHAFMSDAERRKFTDKRSETIEDKRRAIRDLRNR